MVDLLTHLTWPGAVAIVAICAVIGTTVWCIFH